MTHRNELKQNQLLVNHVSKFACLALSLCKRTRIPESGKCLPLIWKRESQAVLDSFTSLFGNKIISFESIVGLHAATHDLDIPWIIIKGISDYKDGGKSGTDCWKKFASLMAASLTVHILSDPMVFRDWPHYIETSEYYNKLPATGICHLFLPPQFVSAN